MKKIILTIDDVPSKNFDELLNYLIKNNHKAIFFCCGLYIEKMKKAKYLIRAIKNGFLIGNHSYSHPDFNKISFEKAKREIIKTDEIIENLYKRAEIKRPTKIFRFPYFHSGESNKRKIQKFLKNLGYKNFYYSNYPFFQKISRGKYDLYCQLNLKDWLKKTTLSLAISRLKKAKDMDVLVLHDHEYSFKNLIKPVCKHLKLRGFTLTY